MHCLCCQNAPELISEHVNVKKFPGEHASAPAGWTMPITRPLRVHLSVTLHLQSQTDAYAEVCTTFPQLSPRPYLDLAIEELT